jgi:hypothetical protein
MVVGLMTAMSAVNGASSMAWNKQAIPMKIALHIGWNLPIDVVGSGVCEWRPPPEPSCRGCSSCPVL